MFDAQHLQRDFSLETFWENRYHKDWDYERQGLI
jgi:hypothetical protein